MKPIKLYWHPVTPNPVKVLLALEELGLPYEGVHIPFDQLKKKPYTDINVNGRLPAIHDPNTDITLWESNAIIYYLTETYDKERKLSFDTSPERFLAQQWGSFQSSGQGPYFGQAAWFHVFHPESVPSAKARYIKEIDRVLSVLDTHLADHEWLVGDRYSWADLAFIPWNVDVERLIEKADEENRFDVQKYKHFIRWQTAILARPAIQRGLAKKANEQVSSST